MINNLINEAAKENIELEVYATTNKEITIEYLNETLSNFKTQDIKEYSIKTIINGATVKTIALDISNPKEILDDLKLERELIDELDTDFLAENIDIGERENCDIAIDSQEIKNNIINFNKGLKEKYKDIHSVRTEYNFEQNGYELVNSNGVNLKDSNYHAYYSSDIVLKINGKNLSCFEYLMGKEIDFDKFKNKIIIAIEKTILKEKSKSIKTNKYNIILTNKITYNILKEFMSDFHASNIIKKQSVFTDKLGNKIFDEKITIVEDPTNKDLIGTRLFDAEGVKTYYKKIVDCGRFTTELYNKKYAEKDSTQSTGNAFGVRNAYIIPGDKNYNELVSHLNDGIIIDYVIGLHSGINHLTGDISLQCEGFLIENGKIKCGLKDIILSTNVMELFNNVKEIGNDLEFFGTLGGAPSLLIENITIAGKEV